MKVLITGKGTSGSHQIRGVQIGHAIGATVIPNATVADMCDHDVVVLVKRPTDQLLQAVRASKRPLVHDIVDAWPQPSGNDWPEPKAKLWLRDYIHGIGADLTIAATKQMQKDIGTTTDCVTIYHHARPEFVGTRAGDTDPIIMAGGYDGAAHYVAPFLPEITRLCQRHNFNCSFQGVAYATFALCLRGQAGYAPAHWKSNVKLANAQALGIPALCSPEAGYQETSTGGVLWINSPDDLAAAFDALADPEHYAKLCAAVDKPPTLEQVAKQYLAALELVVGR